MRKKQELLIATLLSSAIIVEGWGFSAKPPVILNHPEIISISRDGSQPKAEVSPKEGHFKIDLRTVPTAGEEKLELLGTAIGSIKDPIAFIKDLETNKQGIYKLGSKIKDAKVIKITMGEVVLEKAGKKETLKLSKRGRSWAKMNGEDSAIIAVSENEAIVNKQALLNKADEILKALACVKVKPYYKSEKVSGMMVEGIAEGSIIAQAGIRNKDIVRTVNGQKINSYQKALQVAKKLQDQSEIKVDIIRNGEIKNLCYRVAK